MTNYRGSSENYSDLMLFKLIKTNIKWPPIWLPFTSQKTKTP